MGKKALVSGMTDVEAHLSAAAAASAQQEVWTSWLVSTFVVANVVAFAYTMYVNNCPVDSSPTSFRYYHRDQGCVFPALGRFSFEPLSINPLFGPSLYTLDKLGALDYEKVVMGGEEWRLFSCIWLHAGVIHVLANMLSLLFIGVRLEQEFGFAKIGTLYLVSGIGGSLMSCLSLRSKISVGASGALFGLLGAMLSELITNWSIYANKCAALCTLILVIMLNMAVGLIPHVDSSAHIGGFITGFLLGFVLLVRPQFGWISRKHIPAGYSMNLVKPKHKVYQHFLRFSALVFLIAGFTSASVKLFNVDRQG